MIRYEGPMPPGAWPVLIRVGKVTSQVGWVTCSEAVPELLEWVAAEMRKIMEERAGATRA